MNGRLLLLAMAVIMTAATASADESGFTPLFDGKSLDGWVQRGGKAEYKVVDGAIVGTSVPKTPNSFLCTPKEYGDFILELEFKVDPTLNSGVQFRSQYVPEGKTVESAGKSIKGGPGGRVFGYQAEIDPSPRSYTGGVYDEGRRGWLKDLKENEPARKAFKQSDWNKYRIECRGDSIKTFINDVPAADFTDKVNAKGFIALQVHGVGNKVEPLTVRWKNIKIKELPAN